MSPLEKLVTPDYSTSQFHLYHNSHLALAASMPLVGLAVAASPTGFLNTLADLTLLAVVPYHAHVGMNQVLTDYANFKSARFAMAGASALATLGMIKLVLGGPGIINSVMPLFTGKKVADWED